MQLIDINLIKAVIGHLMHKPSLLENPDYLFEVSDFVNPLPKVIFMTIWNMKMKAKMSDEEFDPIIIDTYINLQDQSRAVYTVNNGLEFCKQCYNKPLTKDFDRCYDRLKKLSLLRSLKKRNFDISHYFKEHPDSVDEEMELIQRLEESSIEDIINHVEGILNELRVHYVKGSRQSGNVAEGVAEMIEEFAKNPEIGECIEGDIFSSCCRGARTGKFYLRSGSSGTGKSRLAIFDSCKIAFPIHWNHINEGFIEEIEIDDNLNLKRKVPKRTLMITTEMDKTEVQTIILAYLSGVNETTIITGAWNEEEKFRIDFANYLMDRYKDYYFLEEISDPNLNNVEAVIKKYATLYGVKYVFYDYIFSSPSLLTQFQEAKIREDVALGLLANQLKQLAKDYNIFVATSTQVNAEGMNKPGFKDENCLRGSKSLADKADMGCIVQRINKEEWSKELDAKYTLALNSGRFGPDTMIGMLSKARKTNKVYPTHVIDIYKMRRGQYKNVRIWCYIDLGTGERYDLFMTGADNIMLDNLNSFHLYIEDTRLYSNWQAEALDWMHRKK